MPHKRVSDDVDHVPIDRKLSKRLKKKPPSPGPLPEYTPILITNPLTYGHGNLSSFIPSTDPYAIFSLFFTDKIFAILRDYINEYAQLYPSPNDLSYARKWKDTTIKELKAYIGAYIWMGIHPETEIEAFWNTDPEKGPIHHALTQHIGLKRWQQIGRFFYISKPQLYNIPRQAVFEKRELSNK